VAGTTLILSDLHLGRPTHAATNVEALRTLWAGADRLVLNGDIAEIHHPEYWAAASRAVVRLTELADEDGLDLQMLSGNHDPFLTDRRHLCLGDGHILVTHGDAIHPAVVPWSPAHARMRRVRAEALSRFQPFDDELEAVLNASQHAAYAEWSDEDALRCELRQSTTLGMMLRPWTVMKIIRYWNLFPRLACDFLERFAPEAGIIVVGHTHRGGAWRFGNRTVLNTGSLGFPGRPYAVRIDDHAGTVSMHPITTSEAGYVLSPCTRHHSTFTTSAGVGRDDESGTTAAAR